MKGSQNPQQTPGKSRSLKNRIVFFGTPQFAAEVLRSLWAHEVQVVAVVTQPDRPKGRSGALSPSPVKEIAKELFPTVPILQPEKASEAGFLEILSSLEANLYVVVAFGQILPQKLLSIPPLGCINVHASLLPKYRGAAPMQRAILGGEKETGIAIQKMVKQLDAGDDCGSKDGDSLRNDFRGVGGGIVHPFSTTSFRSFAKV